MIGAFVPTVIAAYVCETECAALSARVGDVHGDYAQVGSTGRGTHELDVSGPGVNVKHGRVCHLASMVWVGPAERSPLRDTYAVTWRQSPVEDAFNSIGWPPPIPPPRACSVQAEKRSRPVAANPVRG